jgi:hypothetical protein
MQKVQGFAPAIPMLNQLKWRIVPMVVAQVTNH